mmetsp:Transcript_22767/g.33902  ORF Transcript_22767/g.33902 Transcript_22767/m.33902 type:complete len:404 (-) Transcript_22767:59-1270(-)
MILYNGKHHAPIAVAVCIIMSVVTIQNCPTATCFTLPSAKQPLAINTRRSCLHMVATKTKKKGGKGMGGGGGMGMGGGSSKSKNGKKDKKAKKMGAAFDVSASVLRSEKLYEELCTESAKSIFREDNSDYDLYSDELIHTEYVIAARYNNNGAAPTPAGFASVSDWVPIAQLCINRPVSSESSTSETGSLDPRVRTAVSYFCRELYFTACLAAPIFKSVPRNSVQYSAESVDSFHRYVYQDVIEHKNHKEDDDNVMTKSRARQVLELEEGCTDLNLIKSAYKKKMLQLHPDRFVGVDRTEEEVKDAEKLYADSRLAFDALSSGVRDTSSTTASSSSNKSWYASLGGRSRTEFYGPIDLLTIDEAKGLFKAFKSAVAGLEYDTVMAFVARNQAAAIATTKSSAQ